MVGVHVVLPDGGQLSLDGKGRLLHLCSIHLTLQKREWKSGTGQVIYALSILTLLYLSRINSDPGWFKNR
jgi:hypothetical protein